MVQPHQRLTRRAALRTLGASALAIPAALGLRDAGAARAWCRTDPIVLIGGTVVDVFVLGPLTALLQVTGPTEVVVTVPVGVSASLLLPDLGFGRGEVVSFAQSAALVRNANGIQVKVDVRVPAKDSSMPVRVEFAPRILGILKPASAEGTANRWVSLTTRL